MSRRRIFAWMFGVVLAVPYFAAIGAIWAYFYVRAYGVPEFAFGLARLLGLKC